MHASLKSDLKANALHRARSAVSTPRGRIRVALCSGAATVAAFAMLAAMSPIPAAHSAQAPLVSSGPAAEPVRYLGGPAALPESAPAEPAIEQSDHVRAGGRIGADLTRALERAGVPERIGREYVAIMGRAAVFGEGLSVEDKFDLVYEREGEGRLLFAGIDRVGRYDVALLKWTDGRQDIWVNADPGATEQQQSGMRMPVAGRVTSQFGSRFHPILGTRRMHKGVDVGAGAGAPIVAAADGRVASAGWAGGYGRQVAIAHADGIRTTYSHMSRIAARAGEAVRQGQVIGYVGSSGLSTGPHLHYEVYRNGRPVNPLSVNMTARPVIEGEKARAMQGKLRELLTVGG